MKEETRNEGRRRIVATTFVTLDGYMVGPDEDISWVAEGFDPDMQEDIADYMDTQSDVFIFGRLTYEIFAAYWPHAMAYGEGDQLAPAEGKEDPRIIKALNERAKLVFSTTLDGSDWANTRIVSNGMEDEIRRLREEPGSAANIQGSASVVQALGRADLIDEYRLYVHPVLLGAGKALFGKGGDRRNLELVETKTYDNGAVALTYQRKNETN